MRGPAAPSGERERDLPARRLVDGVAGLAEDDPEQLAIRAPVVQHEDRRHVPGPGRNRSTSAMNVRGSIGFWM
jgi:hypothetical protein